MPTHKMSLNLAKLSHTNCCDSVLTCAWTISIFGKSTAPRRQHRTRREIFHVPCRRRNNTRSHIFLASTAQQIPQRRIFFDATDWIYLNYATGKFNIAGGKQVVAIGGWEYDRHPADLYSTSVFWQNIPCYQLGASVGYDITGKDRLTLQATQSLFHTSANRNMYAYNLMWNGSHGIYTSIWSTNLVEYLPGR